MPKVSIPKNSPHPFELRTGGNKRKQANEDAKKKVTELERKLSDVKKGIGMVAVDGIKSVVQLVRKFRELQEENIRLHQKNSALLHKVRQFEEAAKGPKLTDLLTQEERETIADIATRARDRVGNR